MELGDKWKGQFVYPAYAGVILAGVGQFFPQLCLSRIRGGDPKDLKDLDLEN